MGLLDDLKREASEQQARNSIDQDALLKNNRLVDGALRALFLYLNDFGKSLNVLKPQCPVTYMLPHVGPMDNLSMVDFFSDYRTMNVDGKDRFTEVYLAFRCTSSQQYVLTRDVVASKRLRDALWATSVKHSAEEIRDERKSLTHEKFTVSADFPVQVNFEGEHPAGLIRVTYKNLGEFNTVTQTIVADRINDKTIEEFAKLVLGRPNEFKQTYLRTTPDVEIRKREVQVPQYVIHEVPDEPAAEPTKNKSGIFGAFKSLIKSDDKAIKAEDDRRVADRRSSDRK
jgi:hypothetical protein